MMGCLMRPFTAACCCVSPDLQLLLGIFLPCFGPRPALFDGGSPANVRVSTNYSVDLARK